MFTKTVVAALALLLLAASANPEWAAQPDHQYRIAVALQEGDSLNVESPVELPWDSLARAAMPTFSFARPDTTLLAENFYEIGAHSEFTFAAPLIPRVPRGHYTGFTTRGLVTLVPYRLHGVVRYDTRPPDWRTDGDAMFYGYLRVRSSAPSDLSQVHFVHWSAAAPSFAEHPAARVEFAGDSIRVSASIPGGSKTWTILGDEDASDGASVTPSARIFVDATEKRTFLLVRLDYGESGNPCLWHGALWDVTFEIPRRVTFTGICDV